MYCPVATAVPMLMQLSHMYWYIALVFRRVSDVMTFVYYPKGGGLED